jgi:hypothetical protein
MSIKTLIKRNQDLSIVLFVYSILALILITFFQYNVGGDGASYISIAHYYATGNWNDAINGYWSPLYSWLIAPFLLYGYDPFLAVILSRAISLAIGFFTIIGVSRLADTFELDKLVKRALLVSTIPIVLLFALRYGTPDLLVTCILLFYFTLMFRTSYSENWTNGFWAGLLGALAYLAKSFVFPFFVVHFLFLNIFSYIRENKRRKVLKNLIIGLSIFFIVSGLWVGTISQKYGEVTIGTAKDYNHKIVGPGYEDPIYLGIIKPPNDSAISIWEDPSTIQLADWNPFSSMPYFEHQLRIIGNNILRSLAFIERFSPLAIIIIILSIFLIFKGKSRRTRDNLIKIITTILIYIGGYSFIFVEPRYLWPICMLVLVTGFYLVNILHEIRFLNPKLKNIFLIILMVSFMVTPTMELATYIGSDSQIPDLSSTLKNDYQIKGNIASNDRWAETLSISYYLESRYFGLTHNSTPASLEEELESNNIDYYFMWSVPDEITLSNYQEITGNRIKNLKIYSRLNRN